MKKLATLFAMTAFGLGSAWAQGTIDFHNPNTFPLRVQDAGGVTTTVGSGGSPLGPASVRVGLWVGPNGSTALTQMSFVAMVTNSASTVPLFVGTFNGGNPYTITPSTPNAQVAFAYAAWSISTGALTYDAALIASTGYATSAPSFGQSYTLGGFGSPPSLPGATFGSGAGQVNGLLLTPVPEPSTLALALLGAAALLIRRRK
jgi:hypothetical protein